MDQYEQNKVFVGGLSWEMDDRGLEACFRKFGRVVEAKVMLDRESNRPRGFGFVTFADKRGMEDAIEKLHNRELDGRVISVTKAQPKTGGKGRGGYGRDDQSSRGRGGYGGAGAGAGGGEARANREDCFKCGQPGHWARDCPTSSGKLTVGDRYGERDRGFGYGGSRYDVSHDYSGDRGSYGRYSSRDSYGGERGYGRHDDGYGRDGRYGDRDRYGGDSYGSSDRYGSDRYGGGGPIKYEGRVKERGGPYDRPSGGRSSVYEGRY